MSEVSAIIAEFSAGGQLGRLQMSKFSAIITEFSPAENSKIGEIEAGNSTQRPRYLPISFWSDTQEIY